MMRVSKKADHLLLLPLFGCCFLTVVGCLGNDESPKPPAQLSAVVGGHVVFNCELDFPQDIEIPYILIWNKDDKKIFSWHDDTPQYASDYSGRIILMNGGHGGYGKGSINLTAIRESDFGWYECKLIFPNRTPASRSNGTWFHLYIEGENFIVVPPVNVTTMEGNEAHFQCITRKFFPELSIRWYKDSRPVDDYPDLLQRSWINENGSLTIKPTSMMDFGEYMCEVQNITGYQQTAKAYLDVQYKAKVIFTPMVLYLPYGRSAVLDCHFRANPPLTNLHWEKDGFLYDPYNVPGVFFKGNGSLYFNKVDESHAGQYSCTPENKLGTEGPSPKISVIVQRPPVFTVTPNSIYLRKLGDSITMVCDAIDSDTERRPTIVWTRRDGTSLPEGRFTLENGNLTLENLQEDDRGLYQCLATNQAATVSTETELMIENVPPRAPYNLIATSTTNSVTLRWAPASTYTRPDIEYSVWYKSVEDEEWRKMPVTSSRMTEATISNLYPGREYEFMVLSQDTFSDGMFSKAIKYRTKDINEEIRESAKETMEAVAELGPPRDVMVHQTPEGYFVNWSPPNHGMDVLKVYTVRWYKESDKQIHEVETVNTYHLIQDLEEDETYYFEVDSVSLNDFKATSEKISIFVPAYGKIKAAVAGVGCVLVLIIIAGVVWYFWNRIKNKKNIENNNKNKSNMNYM